MRAGLWRCRAGLAMLAALLLARAVPAQGLGQGLALEDAIGRARDYVRTALANAPGLGAGHGPMGPGVRLSV